MIVQNTRESSKYKKMFEWGGAAKEEYYISVSKKFKVISPRVRNERKWSFQENVHQKCYTALYTI